MTRAEPMADFTSAYWDAWNAHDAERVTSFMTDDVVFEDLTLGERCEGPAAVRALVAWGEASMSSDYRFEPGAVVSDGEGYALEWTMVGTNDRPDPEHGVPATGRTFHIAGVSIGRLRDGRIAENRDYWDLAGYLQQLGVMPAPQGLSAPGRWGGPAPR